jgi:hypothetical protein
MEKWDLSCLGWETRRWGGVGSGLHKPPIEPFSILSLEKSRKSMLQLDSGIYLTINIAHTVRACKHI